VFGLETGLTAQLYKHTIYLIRKILLVEWISVNHLRFYVSKCKSMLISRKRNPPQCPVLSLCGQVLEQVECFKYLGVLLTSDLTWSKHTECICAKVKKLLGMIYRHFSEYSNPDTLLHIHESMVRPHLEYASQVWDPQLQKDIRLLEGVQKFLHLGCVERTMT